MKVIKETMSWIVSIVLIVLSIPIFGVAIWGFSWQLGFGIGMLVMAIMMLVCAGIVMWVLNFGPKYKTKERIRLKHEGIQITADFRELIVDYRLQIQMRHPFRVIVTGVNPLTSMKQEFTSHHFWRQPVKMPKKFKVYVDPNKPKKYAVELGF